MSHLNAEFLLPPGLCLGVLLGGEGLAQQRLLKLLAQAAAEREQLRPVVPADRQNESNILQAVWLAREIHITSHPLVRI